ncbi:MAG: glycosyltransferase family 2 protein [Pirellulales bacterium]
MKRSLSVFLPVFNGQAWLARLVCDLVEVVPELTPRFDVVMIDDASTDATSEVAYELALKYPQVHLVVHPSRWGRHASMRTGLLHSSGEIVLFREADGAAGLTGLSQLWQSIRGHDLVVSYSAAALGRIPAYPGSTIASAAARRPALQIIRRRALEAWRRLASDEDWCRYFNRAGFRCLQLEAAPPSGPSRLPGRPAAVDPPSRPKRPNYLQRLKAFTWGE